MSPHPFAITHHCELLCLLHLGINFRTNLKLVLKLLCMRNYNVFRIEF
jgi:hypothetical protein